MRKQKVEVVISFDIAGLDVNEVQLTTKFKRRELTDQEFVIVKCIDDAFSDFIAPIITTAKKLAVVANSIREGQGGENESNN